MSTIRIYHHKPGPKPKGLLPRDRIIILLTLILTVGASLYFSLQSKPSLPSFSLAQTEIVWEAAH